MPLDLAASTAKGQRPLLCFAFCESLLLIGPSAIQSPKTGYRYGTVGWTCRHQLSPIIAPSSRSSVAWAGTRAKAHPGTAYLGCTYVQRTSSPCRQRRGLNFVSEGALWQPSSQFGLSRKHSAKLRFDPGAPTFDLGECRHRVRRAALSPTATRRNRVPPWYGYTQPCGTRYCR